MTIRPRFHKSSPSRLWPALALPLSLFTAACSAEADDELVETLDPAGSGAPDRALLDAETACSVAPVTIAHSGGSPQQARIHKLSVAEHPEALCNDGTPAYFVFRPGFGAGAKRWHVFLEGGGQCGSGEECAHRWRTSRGLMTSDHVVDGAIFPQTFSGIKSPLASENPDFYDANLVQVHYCSSDLWSGAMAATPGLPVEDMRRWHFRGRAIVGAVFEELSELGFSTGDELMLNGGSAGGFGVANTADDVRASLPASIRMLALQDAGFGLIYPPYDPVTRRESTARPYPQELEFVAATQSWGGRGDATCEAQAGDELERAACRIPSAIFPSGQVTSRIFVRQSQLDAVQTKRLIDPEDDSPPARAYRERFGAAMRATLASLPGYFSVFSTHDAEHGIMGKTEGWTTRTIDGVVLRDAVGAWYRDPCRGGAKRIEP